jgi:hypothetical protein
VVVETTTEIYELSMLYMYYNVNRTETPFHWHGHCK